MVSAGLLFYLSFIFFNNLYFFFLKEDYQVAERLEKSKISDAEDLFLGDKSGIFGRQIREKSATDAVTTYRHQRDALNNASGHQHWENMATI